MAQYNYWPIEHKAKWFKSPFLYISPSFHRKFLVKKNGNPLGTYYTLVSVLSVTWIQISKLKIQESRGRVKHSQPTVSWLLTVGVKELLVKQLVVQQNSSWFCEKQNNILFLLWCNWSTKGYVFTQAFFSGSTEQISQFQKQKGK